MRVSALIPTFDRVMYVQRAIDSVLAQTLPVDEIVVIDDGSTDGTADLIERRFGTRVRVIRQKNQGVSGARRRAIQEAQHEWVAFLDSDDEWTADRNRLLTEAATKCPPDVAWVFGNTRIVYDRGESGTIFARFGLLIDHDPQIFKDSITLQHPFQFGLLQASLIRRDALVQVNAFGTGLHHSEDFLAGVKVACRYQFAAIDAVVCRLYRTSDLRANSLDLAGRASPDYCLARMMAFSLILESGRKGPWAEEYAEAVRGLCKIRAERREDFRRMAIEQFRYGISAKSIAFGCAAMMGRRGLRTWAHIGRLSRRVRGQKEEQSLTLGWVA